MKVRYRLEARVEVLNDDLGFVQDVLIVDYGGFGGARITAHNEIRI